MLNMEELEGKMRQAMSYLKESVELSLKLKSEGGDTSKQVMQIWESFMKHLIKYLRQREQETGQAILKEASLFDL